MEWVFIYLVRWLPHIWTVGLLKSIYVIKVVQFLLSTPACSILKQANEHAITHIPVYKPIQMWTLTILGRVGSRIAPSSSHSSSVISILGQPEVDLSISLCTNQCHFSFTLEKSATSVNFGLNAFNHPWTYQVSYIFPFPVLGALVLSKFLEEYITGQFQTSSCTLLDGASPGFPQLSIYWKIFLIGDLSLGDYSPKQPNDK